MTDPFDRLDRRDRDELRFDEELRRATRTLISEELPRGVLDPSVGAALGLRAGNGTVRARRALSGFTSLAGAVAVLLLATAVVLAPGSPSGPAASPTTSPSPTAAPSPTGAPSPTPPSGLRTTAEIRADLVKLRYTCSDGLPLSTIEPGPDAVVRESVVCVAPADSGPLDAAVIVGESASGQVVEVHAKADIVGADTPEARDAVAAVLAKAAAVAAQKGASSTLATWVLGNVPSLALDEGTSTELLGLGLKLGRSPNGGYLLSVHLPLA
ncbi:MAG: hypothetical protein ABIZ52_01095 [Candidatus Limnocylindrales bacterium]